MEKSLKVLYWIPRLLCIMAILFLSIFALDAFNPKITFVEQIQHFLMHLIPSFVLVALLIVAWKWEMIGGLVFITIGLVFMPIIFMYNYNMNQSIPLSLVIVATIPFPFVMVGALFVASHVQRKKKKANKA